MGWYRMLKKSGRDDLIGIAHEVSRNNPEHFPNMALNCSSSDSSSDTSTASSDSSASVDEVTEEPELITNSLTETSVSSSHELAMSAQKAMCSKDDSPESRAHNDSYHVGDSTAKKWTGTNSGSKGSSNGDEGKGGEQV